jgi:hypothetical protein
MLRGRIFLLAAFEGEHVKTILVSMETQMLGIKFFSSCDYCSALL